ncbi:MAG: lipid A deacylase LpxR family protein [Bacteroidales bacterium]
MRKLWIILEVFTLLLMACRHEEKSEPHEPLIIRQPCIVFYYPTLTHEDSLKQQMGPAFFAFRDSLTRVNTTWRRYADSLEWLQINTDRNFLKFLVHPGYEVLIDTRKLSAPYGIFIFEGNKAPEWVGSMLPPMIRKTHKETPPGPTPAPKIYRVKKSTPLVQPVEPMPVSRSRDSLGFMQRLRARISHFFERKTEFTYTHSEPAFAGAVSRKKVVILGIENDIFAGTDMWYTNGTTGEWISPAWQHAPLSRLLLPSRKASVDYYGLQIRQNLYTAKYPFWEGIQYGDRPFAAYLTIGNFKISNDPRRRLRLQSSLDVGIIGPHAYGGQVQKFIHSSAKEPVGWENQIRDDIVLKYSILSEKSIFFTPGHDLTVDAGLNAGTLYNNAFAGLAYRFARFDRRYSDDLPEAFRPGMWGEVFRKTQLEAFARLQATAIFYDATLQGGMFNHSSPYTIREKDLSRYVIGGSGGVSASFNGLSVAFSMYMISPEFDTFRRWHKWGRLSVAISW